MGGPEGVVYEHGAAARIHELLRKGRVVLLFLGMEADVFEEQYPTVAQGLGHRDHGGPDAVGSEGHRLAQQLGEARRHRGQAELWRGTLLGPAQV